MRWLSLISLLLLVLLLTLSKLIDVGVKQIDLTEAFDVQIFVKVRNCAFCLTIIDDNTFAYKKCIAYAQNQRFSLLSSSIGSAYYIKSKRFPSIFLEYRNPIYYIEDSVRYDPYNYSRIPESITESAKREHYISENDKRIFTVFTINSLGGNIIIPYLNLHCLTFNPAETFSFKEMYTECNIDSPQQEQVFYISPGGYEENSIEAMGRFTYNEETVELINKHFKKVIVKNKLLFSDNKLYNRATLSSSYFSIELQKDNYYCFEITNNSFCYSLKHPCSITNDESFFYVEYCKIPNYYNFEILLEKNNLFPVHGKIIDDSGQVIESLTDFIISIKLINQEFSNVNTGEGFYSASLDHDFFEVYVTVGYYYVSMELIDCGYQYIVDYYIDITDCFPNQKNYNFFC